MIDEPQTPEPKTETRIAAVRLALALVGGGCLVAGAALIYAPAGWLVAGALLFSVGMIGALRG